MSAGNLLQAGTNAFEMESPMSSVPVIEDIDAIDSQILQLKSRRNAMVPISRLPAEILMRIFVLLARLEKPKKKSKKWWDWLIITKICHLWRSVALDCPTLWTDIEYFYDVGKVKAFLDRSGKASLYVWLGGPYVGGHVSPQIAELIAMDLERVRELTISTKNETEWNMLQRVFTDSIELRGQIHLKKMALSANPHACDPTTPQSHSIHLDCFNRFTTQVEDLTIDSLSLSWKSSLFRGLSRLDLSNVKETARQPTVEELLEILVACPNLQSLGLEDAGPRAPTNIQRSLVDLPHLNSIYIWGVNHVICVDLFNHVIVPRNAEWFITCRDYPFENPEPFIPKLLERTGRCDIVIICFNDDVLSFVSDTLAGDYPPPTSLELIWEEGPSLDLTTQSIFITASVIIQQNFWCNAEMLTFDMQDMEDLDLMRSIRKDYWIHLFRRMSKVTSLTITFPKHHTGVDLEAEVMAAIMELNDPNQYNDKFCPDLQVLCFDNAKFARNTEKQAFEKLIEYLEHRVQLGIRLDRLHLGKRGGLSRAEIDDLMKMNIVNVVFSL